MAEENRHRRVQIYPGHITLIPLQGMSTGPIGVFDSGVGGLSVLRALMAELPDEQFVYVADSGHAPYGERDDHYLIQRSHAIVRWFHAHHQIKALVVACNTATAAAIHILREAYPALPIIGIEPALKPAVSQSKTKVIGVMATRSTLNSEKFKRLMDTLANEATFVLQPCPDLVPAIEQFDAIRIGAACADYTGAIGVFGSNLGQIDTLVLGCTHYPFAEEALRLGTGPGVTFLEGGLPVARQTRRLLQAENALRAERNQQQAQVAFYSTGDTVALGAAANRWLGLHTTAGALSA